MTNVIDSRECGNVYIEITQDKGGSYKVTASENGKIFDKKTYCDMSKAKSRFRSLCKKYCTNESLIKEIDNSNAVQLKTESKNFTGYLVKSATGQKKFWNPDSSYVNLFAKKESAIKKLYHVIAKLPEYAFYDEDEIYDFEDADELADAEFAKFYITDASGKKIIEDITEEVKDHLLADEEFVSKVIEDDDDYFDDEEDLDECKEMSVMVKKLTLNEGSGAGYTIEWKDYDDVTVSDFSVDISGDGYVYIDVMATGKIFDVEANSYYYGTGNIRKAPIEISQIIIDEDNLSYYLDDYDEDEQDISEYMFDNELVETIIGDFLRDDNKYDYGGGYIHSTYDGTIADASERKRYGGGITAKITDENIIDYIDRSVSGDTIIDEYRLMSGSETIEAYPTEESAREAADELFNSGEYDSLVCYHDWYHETLDGDLDFMDGEKEFELGGEDDEFYDEDEEE